MTCSSIQKLQWDERNKTLRDMLLLETNEQIFCVGPHDTAPSLIIFLFAEFPYMYESESNKSLIIIIIIANRSIQTVSFFYIISISINSNVPALNKCPDSSALSNLLFSFYSPLYIDYKIYFNVLAVSAPSAILVTSSHYNTN